MESRILSVSEETLLDMAIDTFQVWSELKDQNILCDATLCTEDGSTFNIHRVIMCSCSSYFKALFTTKIHEKPHTRIKIPGVSASMMNLIIEYAYTGQTNVNENNIIDLLPAVDQFNVLGMLIECCKFLLEKMCPENCIGFKKFAQSFFCYDLETLAYNFLMSRFVDVAERSEELMELSIDELIPILKSDDLNVSNEEIVWETAIKWIDKDPEQRREHTAELMRCVKLGLLETSYFTEKVKKHHYVENNTACMPVVNETLYFLYELETISRKTVRVETPMLARPRNPHVILFTVGGWSNSAPSSIIETYDTRADRWIQVLEVDPEGPRAYHKCAVIGYEIYIIGGFNGAEYFRSCRCFNAVTKEWRSIAPMHSRRCYVSVAVIDNIIYAMGGYDGHHRHKSVEKYDFGANQWTLIAPMSIQRSDACATSLNNLIYIVGGFNGSECLNTCEFYNSETDQWTAVSPMRQKRSGVSIISHKSHIYALGGFNGISRLVSGEKYDPNTDNWTALTDMFNPRSNFAIEVMDDMIFAIGGFNGVTTIFHVECYDEKSNEWYEATDMNAFRSALSACVIAGLPNVKDYIHKKRDNLMEEKRLKLLHQKTYDSESNNRSEDDIVNNWDDQE